MNQFVRFCKISNLCELELNESRGYLWQRFFVNRRNTIWRLFLNCFHQFTFLYSSININWEIKISALNIIRIVFGSLAHSLSYLIMTRIFLTVILIYIIDVYTSEIRSESVSFKWWNWAPKNSDLDTAWNCRTIVRSHVEWIRSWPKLVSQSTQIHIDKFKQFFSHSRRITRRLEIFPLGSYESISIYHNSQMDSVQHAHHIFSRHGLGSSAVNNSSWSFRFSPFWNSMNFFFDAYPFNYQIISSFKWYKNMTVVCKMVEYVSTKYNGSRSQASDYFGKYPVRIGVEVYTWTDILFELLCFSMKRHKYRTFTVHTHRNMSKIFGRPSFYLRIYTKV